MFIYLFKSKNITNVYGFLYRGRLIFFLCMCLFLFLLSLGCGAGWGDAKDNAFGSCYFGVMIERSRGNIEKNVSEDQEWGSLNGGRDILEGVGGEGRVLRRITGSRRVGHLRSE